MSEQKAIQINCVKCGTKNVNINYLDSIRNQLIEHQMCFDCNFWRNILAEDEFLSPANIALVIDGQHYQCPKTLSGGNSRYRGMAGRTFTIRLKSTGEVFQTNDLWNQGEIPAIWKDSFPENAEFVKGGFTKIGKDGGAWDN